MRNWRDVKDEKDIFNNQNDFPVWTDEKFLNYNSYEDWNCDFRFLKLEHFPR